DRRARGVVRAAGRADVSHGAARGGRPGAGVQPAPAATAGAADHGAAGSVARTARGRRPDAQGPARPRGAAHRAAPHVRALRGGPLRVPRAPPPALGAGQRPARQLADERLGPRGATAVPHAPPGRRALRRLTYGGVVPRRTPTSSR